MRRVLARITIVVTAGIVGLLFGAAGPAGATHSTYNAGAIVSDSRFTNYNTMSEADIQNWLVAQNAVCLKDYRDAEPIYDTTQPRNVRYEGSVLASRIIWKAAQQFQINPHVIIVTLQKENSFVTTTSCDSWKYRTAMGMGCPDGANCDSSYYGFSRQVWEGTKLLRNCFWQDVGWFCSYIPSTTGFVKYNPDSSCGGTNVFISNRATATLYTYTPYQPNAAALSTMGTAPCGAYGNRNFLHYIDTWFPEYVYGWQFAGQSSDKDITNLAAGEKATLTVLAKNTGSATWTNSGGNPLKLGTSNPRDRSSSFSTPSWPASNRAALMQEASVAPGQTGTFVFQIQAPAASGTYKEYFNPVAEGAAWLNDIGQHFVITVVPANLAFTVTGNTVPAEVITENAIQGTITVRNDGNLTWYKDGRYPFKLGTYSPADRSSVFRHTDWPSDNRAAILNEASVAPGATGTFTLKLLAPRTPGNYTEGFSVVAEGFAWSGQTISLPVKVKGTYQASALSNPTVNLIAGSSASVTLTFTNAGTATWSTTEANPIRLGTAEPKDRTSQFCDSSWISCNRAATINEASVAPGATGSFTFTIKTNYLQDGNLKEYFSPVVDGQEWFGTPAAYVTVSVTAADFSYSVASTAAYTNSGKTTVVDLSNLSPGQTAWLVLRATNAGNITWSNSGSYPVRLGTDGPRDRTSLFQAGGWLGGNRAAAMQEASVAPAGVATFEFPIQVPSVKGDFSEKFNLVADGLAWMKGSAAFPLKVKGGYTMQFIGQYAYTDATKTTPVDTTSLSPGQVFFFGVIVKNTGDATWYKSGSFPLRLGTYNPIDHTSPFRHASWLLDNRIAGMNETSVIPGQNATFEGYYTAPSGTGSYRDYMNLVADGIKWLNDWGIHIPATVR